MNGTDVIFFREIDSWRIDPLTIEIQETIGTGGFGKVSKGLMSGCVPVAIKTAHRSVSLESLLKEIHILTTVRSVYCVRLIGIMQQTDTELSIVTEFIEGGDLATALYHTQERLSELLRLKFARDIALGLQYLHQLNIIHRDLKPENCLVRTTSLSAHQHVVLADFGLSKVIVSNANSGYMTLNVGSNIYMAPG